MPTDKTPSNDPHHEETLDSFASNPIRLSLREWMIALGIVVLIYIGLPRLWRRIEPFERTADYRIPYELSDDYWTFGRLIQDDTGSISPVVLGDSVIWGEYVKPDGTLTHFLNRRTTAGQFVNGGVNGTHPLALAGLVRYYGQRLPGRKVLLHCNLLWLSSAERDLQTEKEVSFNHPGLVPQFFPRIPCYKASLDSRMGVLIDRHSTLRGWVHHHRIRSFESLDVPSWSLEHPYANPLTRLTNENFLPLDKPHSTPIPWTERGIPVQDIPWVDLEDSLQWQGFCTTVRLLRQRGSRLFVMIGPFNEHLLSEASQQRYEKIKESAVSWLRAERVPHIAPPPLPSSEYGDASHPLVRGYERLAAQLIADTTFQDWLAHDAGR